MRLKFTPWAAPLLIFALLVASAGSEPRGGSQKAVDFFLRENMRTQGDVGPDDAFPAFNRVSSH